MLPRSLPFAAVAVVAAAATLGLATAHGGATATPAPAPQLSALRAEDLLAPKGRPTLRAEGRVAARNTAGGVALRLTDIERLGARRVTLREPFKQRTMTFRAVPLKAVVDLVRPQAGTSALHATALNDYVVDLPLDVARGDGVWLATRNADGSPIAVAEGGPIRVVFTEGARGATMDTYWIWSLASLELR